MEQSNFQMGPNTWQSAAEWGTTAAPASTTQRQVTHKQANIFIQNVNAHGFSGKAHRMDPAYNNLPDLSSTQTPAFFHASPVKEAQANGVINGHVSFHDPFEQPSGNAQQSIYDKGFPGIAKPIFVQENPHKSETNGQYKPFMNGNVNFGLPNRNAGNVWNAPLTTEISVFHEGGSVGGQGQGSGGVGTGMVGAPEYNRWGTTQTPRPYFENTGFSTNVVENIEMGLLSHQNQMKIFQSLGGTDFNNPTYVDSQQPSVPDAPIQQQIAMPPTNVNFNTQQWYGVQNNVQQEQPQPLPNPGMDNSKFYPQQVSGGSNQFNAYYPYSQNYGLGQQAEDNSFMPGNVQQSQIKDQQIRNNNNNHFPDPSFAQFGPSDNLNGITTSVQASKIYQPLPQRNYQNTNPFSMFPKPEEDSAAKPAPSFSFNGNQNNENFESVLRMRNEMDRRQFNKQFKQKSPFSINQLRENPDQEEEMKTTIPPSRMLTTTEKVKSATPPLEKTKPPVEEIIIETTLPPKTSTQSFIQFLQFVFEQRELAKRKVKLSELDEMVKSIKAAPTTESSVYAETPSSATPSPDSLRSKATRQNPTTSPPVSEKKVTTPTPTTTIKPTNTAAPTTLSSSTSASISTSSVSPETKKVGTVAPEVVSLKPPASVTTPPIVITSTLLPETSATPSISHLNGITDPTTTVNFNKMSTTLKSVLADIKSHTTVRIKLRSVPGEVKPEITVEYVTPTPPKENTSGVKPVVTSTVPTTTFRYGLTETPKQELTFRSPKTIGDLKPRIKIIAETTPTPATTAPVPDPQVTDGPSKQGSEGLTNSQFSHFQFTDSSTQRMDVVDYSKDIPLNKNEPTTNVPLDNSGRINEKQALNYGPGRSENTAQENLPSRTTVNGNNEEGLPANATFHQRILFLKRQQAARENPVEALKKFADPSANMLNLIKLLPKDNNSPMAATDEAGVYTRKSDPPQRKTTSQISRTTPSPETMVKRPSVATKNTNNSRGPQSKNQEMRNTQVESKQAAQNTANNPATKTRGRRPLTSKQRAKLAKDKNQCVYFGKVFRAGQRFKNNSGKRCRCMKGGRVKCRR